MANVRSGSISVERIAVILLLTGLILGLIGPRLWAARPDGNGSEATQTVHVVESGESLWKLAEKYAADEDPRAFVFEIRRLNGLVRSSVSPGQELIIPVG